MADDDQTEAGDETLDASYKPDAAVLDGDEADFAKSLGFGLDGNEGAETQATDEVEVAPSATAPTTDEDAPGDAAAAAAADDEGATDAGEDASETDASADEAPPVEDEGDAAEAHEPPGEASQEAVEHAPAEGGVDYEEIHPRPASEGIQDTLQARADDVLSRSGADAPTASRDASAEAAAPAAVDDEALVAAQQALSDRDRALAAALADLDATHADLAAARAELDGGGAGDEKELEETRVELETVTIERDQLIDQLAATSGQLVQSQRAAEQLEASLRAARGALIPLPEGERALRAEVIGLRGRLDEAAQENVRLASEVASVATELAIAAARVEDRQHEIDYHADRARDLEAELAEKDEHVEETIGRHREALALATRLQAENTELRGAQAALEETLQARDLEIAAREEHLRVTREGLTSRDTQLVDLAERVEQERHRIEALEADLERAEIEKGVLLDKVARRESRIATLTQTLGQIEEAMGRRMHLTVPAQPVLAQAEWTRPAPPSTGSVGARPGANDEAREADAPASEPAAAPSLPPDAPAPTPPIEPAPVTTLPPEADLEEDLPLPRVDAVEDDSPAPRMDAVEEDLPVPRMDAVEEDLPVPRVDAVEDDLPVLRERAPESFDDATEDAEATPGPRLLHAVPTLPPILGRWRDERVAELGEAEADSVADFLAQRLDRLLGDPGPEALFLRSVGGALPDAEARLVAALAARGVEGIRMEVLDADEDTAQARRSRIERAGLGHVIDVRVGDLGSWDPEAPCHAILLADALHAQARPDVVLDHLAPSIEQGAILLFAGRIGAGPVQLSASTLMRLEELWQFLPEPMAATEGLGRAPFRGDDGGTPVADIDPAAALVDRFDALALVGFGHLADLVVGPSRGFGLSDEEADARQLVASVVALDESRGLTESLPPRHGLGVFARGSAGRTECYGQPWPCLADALR